MVIDNKILDDLSAQAKANPRLRQAMDLRNSPEDLRGCEKEIAEKYLMKIAQVLANRNHLHPFWECIKRSII